MAPWVAALLLLVRVSALRRSPNTLSTSGFQTSVVRPAQTAVLALNPGTTADHQYSVELQALCQLKERALNSTLMSASRHLKAAQDTLQTLQRLVASTNSSARTAKSAASSALSAAQLNLTNLNSSKIGAEVSQAEAQAALTPRQRRALTTAEAALAVADSGVTKQRIATMQAVKKVAIMSSAKASVPAAEPLPASFALNLLQLSSKLSRLATASSSSSAHVVEAAQRVKSLSAMAVSTPQDDLGSSVRASLNRTIFQIMEQGRRAVLNRRRMQRARAIRDAKLVIERRKAQLRAIGRAPQSLGHLALQEPSPWALRISLASIALEKRFHFISRRIALGQLAKIKAACKAEALAFQERANLSTRSQAALRAATSAQEIKSADKLSIASTVGLGRATTLRNLRAAILASERKVSVLTTKLARDEAGDLVLATEQVAQSKTKARAEQVASVAREAATEAKLKAGFEADVELQPSNSSTPGSAVDQSLPTTGPAATPEAGPASSPNTGTGPASAPNPETGVYSSTGGTGGETGSETGLTGLGATAMWNEDGDQFSALPAGTGPASQATAAQAPPSNGTSETRSAVIVEPDPESTLAPILTPVPASTKVQSTAPPALVGSSPYSPGMIPTGRMINGQADGEKGTNGVGDGGVADAVALAAQKILPSPVLLQLNSPGNDDLGEDSALSPAFGARSGKAVIDGALPSSLKSNPGDLTKDTSEVPVSGELLPSEKVSTAKVSTPVPSIAQPKTLTGISSAARPSADGAGAVDDGQEHYPGFEDLDKPHRAGVLPVSAVVGYRSIAHQASKQSTVASPERQAEVATAVADAELEARADAQDPSQPPSRNTSQAQPPSVPSAIGSQTKPSLSRGPRPVPDSYVDDDQKVLLSNETSTILAAGQLPASTIAAVSFGAAQHALTTALSASTRAFQVHARAQAELEIALSSNASQQDISQCRWKIKLAFAGLSAQNQIVAQLNSRLQVARANYVKSLQVRPSNQGLSPPLAVARVSAARAADLLEDANAKLQSLQDIAGSNLDLASHRASASSQMDFISHGSPASPTLAARALSSAAERADHPYSSAETSDTLFDSEGREFEENSALVWAHLRLSLRQKAAAKASQKSARNARLESDRLVQLKLKYSNLTGVFASAQASLLGAVSSNLASPSAQNQAAVIAAQALVSVAQRNAISTARKVEAGVAQLSKANADARLAKAAFLRASSDLRFVATKMKARSAGVTNARSYKHELANGALKGILSSLSSNHAHSPPSRPLPTRAVRGDTKSLNLADKLSDTVIPGIVSPPIVRKLAVSRTVPHLPPVDRAATLEGRAAAQHKITVSDEAALAAATSTSSVALSQTISKFSSAAEARSALELALEEREAAQHVKVKLFAQLGLALESLHNKSLALAREQLLLNSRNAVVTKSQATASQALPPTFSIATLDASQLKALDLARVSRVEAAQTQEHIAALTSALASVNASLVILKANASAALRSVSSLSSRVSMLRSSVHLLEIAEAKALSAQIYRQKHHMAELERLGLSRLQTAKTTAAYLESVFRAEIANISAFVSSDKANLGAQVVALKRGTCSLRVGCGECVALGPQCGFCRSSRVCYDGNAKGPFFTGCSLSDWFHTAGASHCPSNHTRAARTSSSVPIPDGDVEASIDAARRLASIRASHGKMAAQTRSKLLTEAVQRDHAARAKAFQVAAAEATADVQPSQNRSQVASKAFSAALSSLLHARSLRREFSQAVTTAEQILSESSLARIAVLEAASQASDVTGAALSNARESLNNVTTLARLRESVDVAKQASLMTQAAETAVISAQGNLIRSRSKLELLNSRISVLEGSVAVLRLSAADALQESNFQARAGSKELALLRIIFRQHPRSPPPSSLLQTAMHSRVPAMPSSAYPIVNSEQQAVKNMTSLLRQSRDLALLARAAASSKLRAVARLQQLLSNATAKHAKVVGRVAALTAAFNSVKSRKLHSPAVFAKDMQLVAEARAQANSSLVAVARARTAAMQAATAAVNATTFAATQRRALERLVAVAVAKQSQLLVASGKVLRPKAVNQGLTDKNSSALVSKTGAALGSGVRGLDDQESAEARLSSFVTGADLAKSIRSAAASGAAQQPSQNNTNATASNVSESGPLGPPAVAYGSVGTVSQKDI